MNHDRTGPLSDVTIIDCTQALAGPFGAAILADLGADVIKIEPPGGDMSRGIPPRPEAYVSPAAGKDDVCDYGGYFASINRNKRSVMLDLKDPDDRDTFLALCEHADAVLENTRTGVMDRLGVGYEVIAERNPKIVYAAIRGFGDPRTGESPYAAWPAYDIVAQSMGGLAHLTGPPGGNGFPSGASVGDLYPGTLMALGVVSAIHAARRTGQGQFVDVGMMDAVMFLSETVVANYGFEERALGPRGAHHPNLCPFGTFPTADGAVAIAAPGPGHWELLCKVMGQETLIDDERTSNVLKRKQHEDFVIGVVSDWTHSLTKAQVIEKLGGQVPCGPVNTAHDLFNDPHCQVREMIAEIDLPGDGGSAEIVGHPIKFTATPSGVYRRPPMLNEHAAEVFAQFGLKNRHRADEAS